MNFSVHTSLCEASPVSRAGSVPSVPSQQQCDHGSGECTT